MPEDSDSQALEFETIAAALRADHGASTDLLNQLARMLEGSYPTGTTIKRGGWVLAQNRPVTELTVRFDEWQFQVIREKHGSFTARSMKLVRGVALKTNEIKIDQCIDDIVKELVKMGEKNAQTRDALHRFVNN